MILKTYTRILTTDLQRTVETLKAVHGVQPHLTIPFESWTIVAIGDVLIVGGTEEALAPIRGSLGPWIVENVDDTKATLVKLGATVVRDPWRPGAMGHRRCSTVPDAPAAPTGSHERPRRFLKFNHGAAGESAWADAFSAHCCHNAVSRTSL
ncbi:MAG TPA: hypothetical protein VF292_05160 [Rhodanobacteraceae bacterium]